MKKLTDVIVNNSPHDAIIEYFAEEYRVDGMIDWVNKMDCIAKCHGDTRIITIVLRDVDDFTKATLIEIKTASIKKLYNEILELEKEEWEMVID